MSIVSPKDATSSGSGAFGQCEALVLDVEAANHPVDLLQVKFEGRQSTVSTSSPALRNSPYTALRRTDKAATSS